MSSIVFENREFIPFSKLCDASTSRCVRRYFRFSQTSYQLLQAEQWVNPFPFYTLFMLTGKFRLQAWRLAFKVTIHTFADMFGDVVKKLERSKELLLHSADIAHYQEAQEFRLRFAREFEAQLEETRKKRMLTVIDWLSPTSCDVDHEELQQKRDEFPDTTRWIFTQKSMRHWLQPDGKSNPIFWICGIPGAGS